MLINYSRVLDDIQYFHKSDMKHIPKSAGVYLFFDLDFCCLYVGESGNLHARVKSSLRRTKESFAKQPEHIFILPESDETERIIVEWLLLRRLAPLYNVLGTNLSETQRLEVQARPPAIHDKMDLQRLLSLETGKENPNE
jgi:excinuclease UvrABC nuclease subunit